MTVHSHTLGRLGTLGEREGRNKEIDGQEQELQRKTGGIRVRSALIGLVSSTYVATCGVVWSQRSVLIGSVEEHCDWFFVHSSM